MSDPRAAYLKAVDTALALLDRHEVAERWERPSALADWSVGGLANHLAAQLFTVGTALTRPPAGEETISLLEHYRRAAWVTASLDDEANASIRRGAEEASQAGPGDLRRRAAAARDLIAEALARTPLDQVVPLPWQGWSLTLHDLLITRMMEISVHVDDLAVSIEVAPPEMPADVIEPVLSLLITLASRRHGQAAVLRALARRERASQSIAAF